MSAAVWESNSELCTGSEIRAAAVGFDVGLYQDTGGRKWGHPYLTRQFFEPWSRERMGDRLLLFFAYRGGTPDSRRTQLRR